jgi:hypothetical protein
MLSLRRCLIALLSTLSLMHCGTPPENSGGGGGGHSGAGGGAPLNTTDSDLVSGTRLKAIRQKSPDGASLPVAIGGSMWWDSQLNVYCVLEPGSNTCLPLGPVSVYGTDSQLWFADSTCTTPLVIQNSTTDWSTLLPGLPAPLPKYAADFTNPVVYDVGMPFSGTPYVQSGSGCTTGTNPPAALFLRGSSVPLSTFVQFTMAIDP